MDTSSDNSDAYISDVDSVDTSSVDAYHSVLSSSNLENSIKGNNVSNLDSTENLDLDSNSNSNNSGLDSNSNSNNSGLDSNSNSNNSGLDSNSNSNNTDLNNNSTTHDSSNSNNSNNLENLTNLDDSKDASNQKPQKYLIPSDSSISSAYIQKVIDNAVPGSTIQFTGSFYKNIYLKIDKALNIISKSGTVINSSYRLPVFTILRGGSGTNISGFTVNLANSFVEASDVSNISISKNKIFTKRKAIVLENVFNSKIVRNSFLRFETAIDISKSGGLTISNNNITPDNGYNVGISLKDIYRDKVSILNNNITGHDRRIESTGIYFGPNAKNVLIEGNIIDEWYTGVDFPNSVNNVSILNNTLNHNGDGVIINGWINNFTFNKNVVTNSGRVGVLFDYDFKGTRGNFILEKNFFTGSGHLDLRNTGDQAVDIGENFASRRCVRVNMKNGFSIRTRQNGNGYYFSIVDKNSRGVSGLPNFRATISINGVSYNVNFINSVAYVEADGAGGNGENDEALLDVGEDKRKLSDWGETQNLSSSEMEYYKKIYDDLIKSMVEETNNDNQDMKKVEDKNGTGSTPNGGNGGGDSGISDGRSSVSSSGDSSPASAGTANVAASSASASAGPSAAQADTPESSTVKSLSLDEETFRVAGVGGLVFLIICVIGLYYREDIMDMIKE